MASYYNSDFNPDLPIVGRIIGMATVEAAGLPTESMQGPEALSAMSELGASWDVTPGYYPHLKALAVKLTFNAHDNTTLDAINFNPGAFLTPPDAGERDGFTFDGWFTSGGQKIDFTQPVIFTKDTVLTAGWTEIPTYTVTFISNGSVHATKTVTAGGSIGNAEWPAPPLLL